MARQQEAAGAGQDQACYNLDTCACAAHLLAQFAWPLLCPTPDATPSCPAAMLLACCICLFCSITHTLLLFPSMQPIVNQHTHLPAPHMVNSPRTKSTGSAGIGSGRHLQSSATRSVVVLTGGADCRCIAAAAAGALAREAFRGASKPAQLTAAGWGSPRLC